MAALISVIIPTYNRSGLIGETLESLISQRFQNWECIVVDDGSTDYTLELMQFYCRKDKRISYYQRPEDRLPGGNAARNFGFEKSKGDYVNWFDSDDIMLEDKLQTHYEFLESGKHICSVSKGIFLNKKEWGGNLSNGNPFDLLVTQKSGWPVNSVVWRRSHIKKVTWNEHLNGGQEWEFHLRATFGLEPSDVINIDKTLDFIREGSDSKTGNKNRIERYSNYLQARISICDFLLAIDIHYFIIYFPSLYQQSLKYIRLLVKNNEYELIKVFAEKVKKYSRLKYMYFISGVVVFKFFKYNFLLKKV